jgi:CRP-like cAMP-binding protein
MSDILARLAAAPATVFEPGASLMREGEETGRLFVLKAGTVEVRRRGVVVTQIAEPGALLGEISTLLERPHTASVVAVTAVEVLALEGGLKSLVAEPGLAVHLAVLLAQRLERSTAVLTALKASAAGKPQRRSLVDRVLALLSGHPVQGGGRVGQSRRQPRPR